MTLSKWRKGMNDQRGFSFVELLVAIILAAILVVIIYQIFVSYRKTVLVQEDVVTIQQAGRNAISRLKEDLMLIGRNAEIGKGQETLIHAAPWEILFNGDVTSTWGQLADGASMTYSAGTYTAGDWNSDAETVRYYINDPSNNWPHQKDYSHSEYDREIRRQINKNPTSDVIGYGVRYDDGTNATAYANGDHIVPLFTYWGDFDLDPTTPDTLWGDTTAPHDVLDNLEIQALLTGGFSNSVRSPSGGTTSVTSPHGEIILLPDSMSNNEIAEGEDYDRNGKLDKNLLGSVIHRIELNITTIAQNPDYNYKHPRDGNYPYRETWISSAVEPRNLTRERAPDFGDPPEPPGKPVLTEEDCGRGITVSWTASPDDGAGENDVVWYEIMRMVNADGSDEYRYIGYVAATGASGYSFFDGNTQIDINENPPPIYLYYAHNYRIIAVDGGNSRSAPSAVSSLTPQIDPVVQPDEDFAVAWDSPCYTAESIGSITVQWQGSQPDNSVTHYCIFRSEPESFIIGEEEPPLACVPKAVSETCGKTHSDELEAHKACVQDGADYYDWGDDMYVWRDQHESPGRGGGALVPLPGTQFDVGLAQQRYFYEVRAYNEDNECYSRPTPVHSRCEDFSDIQSFDCSMASGDVPRALFTPPIITDIVDCSTFDYNGQLENGCFQLQWSPSQTEWCSPTGQMQDPDWYYVYRSKFSQQFIVDPNDGSFLAGDNVIVYPALMADDRDSLYTWKDSNDLWKENDSHSPWQLDASDGDKLFPNSGSTVPDAAKLGNWDYSGDRSWYEYMVVAANTNGTGIPNSVNGNWGFGASCVERASFTCDSSCNAEVAEDTGYAEQKSMRGYQYSPLSYGDADITVYWEYAIDPPADSTVELWAREWLTQTWVQVAGPGEINNSGGQWYAKHPYNEQIPGTIYEYSLLITCAPTGSSEGCKRRILVGATIGAGVPGVPEICSVAGPECPADTGPHCDGIYAGSVVFYIDTFSAMPEEGFDNTDDNYLWFRIARWEKYPLQPTFPLEPAAEYLLRYNVGSNTLVNYVDQCPPYCNPAVPPLNLTQRFLSFPGSFNNQTQVGTLRRFRYQEYLDPHRLHRFTIEVRIQHSGSPPRDCDIPNSTCNGPEDEYVYADFTNMFPCYPYKYPGWPSSNPNPQTSAYLRDYFTHMHGDISASSVPWQNYELTFISWHFWSTHFYLGDYMFRYGNDFGSQGIMTDFEGLFGHLFNWVVQWLADIGYGMCDFCITLGVVDLFCVDWVWPDCYEDMTALFNHSFLWSRFTPNGCGYSGVSSGITGNFLMHWHWMSKQDDRRLVMAFRGRYVPAQNHVDSWMIEQDFGSTNWVYYTVAYEYRTECEDEYWTREYFDEVNDDDWWANLLLVCQNLRDNSLGEGQMYIFWWNELDNQGGHQKDLQQTMYNTAPKLAWHTIGARFGSTPYYNSNYQNPDRIGHSTGNVGFWADPYIDWDADNYAYDNIRIIPYCGACPPQQLQGYLPSPYKAMSWKAGKEQRTKASCAGNWKKSYESNDGIPPVRPSALESYRRHGMSEVPENMDPWYVPRKRLERKKAQQRRR